MRDPRQESPEFPEHAGTGRGSLPGPMTTTLQEIDREAARRVAEVLAMDEANAGAAPEAVAAGAESTPAVPIRAVHKGAAVCLLAAAVGLVLLLIGRPRHGEAIAGSLERPGQPLHGRPTGPSGASLLSTPIQGTHPADAKAGASAAEGTIRRAVQWREEDGGNGHWYLLVTTSAPISWEHARSEALRVGGDLATFSSLAEVEQFISRHANAGPHAAWIGLYQDSSATDYSEPRGGWRWVTGEPVGWTHWSTGEPNEVTGRENYANMWLNQSGTPGSWNDYQFGGPASYVVEWPSARGSCSCDDLDFLPDRRIDAADLLIWLTRGREPDRRAAHDLNHDGSVDVTDLEVFRSLWGPCPR